jgi:hypothetical protein
MKAIPEEERILSRSIQAVTRDCVLADRCESSPFPVASLGISRHDQTGADVFLSESSAYDDGQIQKSR